MLRHKHLHQKIKNASPGSIPEVNRNLELSNFGKILLHIKINSREVRFWEGS